MAASDELVESLLKLVVEPAEPAKDSPAPCNGISVIKSLVGLSAALKREDSPVRIELAKSADGQVAISKMGGATEMLDRIAAMFGLDPKADDDGYRDLSWKVGDMVRTLQQAAMLETTIATLAAALPAVAKAEVAKAAPKPPAATLWPTDVNVRKAGATAWNAA